MSESDFPKQLHAINRLMRSAQCTQNSVAQEEK